MRIFSLQLCVVFILACTVASGVVSAQEDAATESDEFFELFEDTETAGEDFDDFLGLEPDVDDGELESEKTAPVDEASEPQPNATNAVVEEAPAETVEVEEFSAGGPEVEEIVIRAAQSEASQDFAAGDSIAAFGAEDLSALGAQDVSDIANFTPNLEIVSPGATAPTFFIRGVGLNDFNANATGAVAIYQDDVPLNASALQLATIFDVSQVNVLRGPHGAGQARNASAGAIKLYSRKPTGEYGGYLRSEFGNYDFINVEGAVETPIFQDLLVGRFAFRYSERSGYARNECGNAPPDSGRAVSRSIDNVRPFDTVASSPTFGLPISICGETVQRVGSIQFPITIPTTFNDGFSPIREGLPSRVNNLNNWAARATLLFQPTLDSEWLLTLRGARRDELSQLGQSAGTTGTVFDSDCLAALPNQPPTPLERNQSGCRILRLLGGVDAGQFQPRETAARLIELNPCLTPGPLGTVLQSGACTGQDENFRGSNDAQLQSARELADLDSKPHLGQYNRAGPTKNDVWGITLKSDTVFGDAYELTTVTSFDAYDRLVDIDLDQSPNQLFELVTDDEGWQFVNTVNLSVDALGGIPVSWDVGGWYLMERIDVVVANFFLPQLSGAGVGGRDYTQKLDSVGVYGQFEFDFWDDFTLDGGARYNWERKTIDYALDANQAGGILFQFEKRTWDAGTGNVRLTYRFREDTRAFWKYTRGWKPGTFNATSSPREGVTSAKPETIDSFEAGLNGSWFDGRFNLAFSVFHYNYENYQIFIAQQTLGAQPEFLIINANNAEVSGAEATIRVTPFEGTDLTANLGWLDSQFLDFVQRQQGVELRDGFLIPVDVTVQNAGNDLLNSPRFKVALTAQQTIELGAYGALIGRWDGAWTDTTSFGPTEGRGIPNDQGVQFLPKTTIGQRPYWLHNVRLTYRSPSGLIEVAGWVRNVADKTFKTFAFDLSNFQATTISFVSVPRTYGFAFSTNF